MAENKLAGDALTRVNRALEARRAQVRLEWREVASNGGIAYETLRLARKTGRMSETTKAAIERGLGLEYGSIDQVVSGGEVTPKATARPRAPLGSHERVVQDWLAMHRALVEQLGPDAGVEAFVRTIVGMVFNQPKQQEGNEDEQQRDTG